MTNRSDDQAQTAENDAGWIYGPEAACRYIAATSWPWERTENRDAWAVTMLDRPDLLADEVLRARERLEAAIAYVTSPATCPHRVPVGGWCSACDMYDEPATAARVLPPAEVRP